MSDYSENIKTVQIVFFSGTGGVKRIADAFKQELLNRGLGVSVVNLDFSPLNQSNSQSDEDTTSVDLVILLFPLHAFDAPDPIYEWIQNTHMEHKKVAVISVSGGGEAWPNTGCRNNCCKSLERKGFDIVYERMMCMPSNWVFRVNDHVAMLLITAIPKKANRILDDILSGKTRRTKFKMGLLRSYVTKMEKRNAKLFAHKLIIDSTCTGCGLCAGQCPVNNIEMKDRKPLFNDRCIMCFRCIYACSSHAIKSNNFMVLKNGYSLIELEKRMQGVELEPINKCCKGFFWSSMRNYLLDKD
jgi:ferredoxin/flavodoxin